MLELQLQQSNWGALLHFMHLANFMARCKPYMATQLASTGMARILLGTKNLLERSIWVARRDWTPKACQALPTRACSRPACQSHSQGIRLCM